MTEMYVPHRDDAHKSHYHTSRQAASARAVWKNNTPPREMSQKVDSSSRIALKISVSPPTQQRFRIVTFSGCFFYFYFFVPATKSNSFSFWRRCLTGHMFRIQERKRHRLKRGLVFCFVLGRIWGVGGGGVHGFQAASCNELPQLWIWIHGGQQCVWGQTKKKKYKRNPLASPSRELTFFFLFGPTNYLSISPPSPSQLHSFRLATLTLLLPLST